MIKFGKTIQTKVSTKLRPCSEKYPKICQEFNDYKDMISRYNCHIPFLNSGHHLEELTQMELPECSENVMKEAILKISNKIFCPFGQVCNTTKYSYNLDAFDMSDSKQYGNISRIYFVLRDPEVEHQETIKSYKIQNLMSEIGGIMGITLGASILSMMQLINNYLESFCQKPIRQ